MPSPTKILIKSLFLAALLAISGCGGSGGSGGIQAPALASPVYSGNTASATLAKSNSASMAIGVQRAIDITASMPERLSVVLQRSVNLGQPATFGTAKSVFPAAYGQVNSDGTGWAQTTFQNMSDGIDGLTDFDNSIPDPATLDFNPVHGTYTLSGTIVYQYLSKLTDPTYHVLISFINLHITGNNLDVTLNGSIDATFKGIGSIPPLNNQQATANLSINDAILGRTWLLTNFSVTSTLQLNGRPVSLVTVSGKFSDAEYGSTDVSTPSAPLTYSYNVYNIGPFDGGYVRLLGAGGTSAYFSSVNYYLASVAVDNAGSGYPTSAVRYSWATGKPDTTPTISGNGPVALAEIERSASIGDPGILDGRLSYSKTGGFVSFAWSVELGPPDSHPSFDNLNSVVPTFTVDRPGDYLIKLVVSDGVNTATDRVVVHARSTPTNISESPQGKSGLSNITAQVGQSLTFDGRVDNFDIQATPRPVNDAWVLTVPAGSSAALDDPQAQNPSFTPDVDGFYTLSDNQSPAITIAVGEPFQFAPLVQFLPAAIFDYVPADLDGHGNMDFVYSLSDAFGVPQEVGILKGNGQGAFSTSQTFDIGVPQGSLLDVGDLNGDGLADIAVNSGFSVTLLIQQLDGSFDIGSTLTPCTGTSGTGGTAEVKLAKIAGDSVDSIFYPAGCSTGVEAYRNDGHGNFTASALIPLQDFYAYWQVADVTGDGIADLVGFSYTLAGTGTNLIVYPGQADGTFGSPITYAFSGSPNPSHGYSPGPILIGDANGDGTNDVVFQIPAGMPNVPNSILAFDQQSHALVTPPTSINTSISDFIGAYGLADINGDGLNDLIFETSGALAIELQDNSHNFSNRVLYPLQVAPTYDSRPQTIRVLDINGDGILDIILPDGRVLIGIKAGQ